MQKLKASLIAILICLSLASCGKKATEVSSEVTATQQEATGKPTNEIKEEMPPQSSEAVSSEIIQKNNSSDEIQT